MAGIQPADVPTYTPVSLGKGNKTRDANRSWIKELRNVDFIDANGLRQLTPETVTAQPVFVMDREQPQYKAIVGDNTHKVYSIRSDKYKIAQNQLLVEALAETSDVTGIQVFGKIHEFDGRMSINAFFANPDCNVDFGSKKIGKDPYMMGVRVYNSHMGDSGFGAEIIGVRYICSNMCAFGDILGTVSWRHLVSQENIVNMISSMVMSYMDRVPALKEKIEAMHDEELTLDEAECALWGIKLTPFMTEGIMSNLTELNPEIRHKNGKVSVYDIFNATTAYNTYSNTGRNEFSRTDINHKAQRLIGSDIAGLIDDGSEARQKYLESQTRMTAQNTVLVSD